MSADRIQIARGSLELGVLSRAEVRDLLDAGFLLPTDLFRIQETEDWRPLEQLPEIVPAARSPMTTAKDAATRVRASATKMAARFLVATGKGGAAIGSAASRLLEDYIPRIRESVGATLAKPAEVIDAKLRDEEFLRKTFGAAYDTLPKPVQRFVSEEAFVEFCLKHKSKLLNKQV